MKFTSNMRSKRGAVPFDKNYFAKKLKSGEKIEVEERFRHIFQKNHWAGDSSVSGSGSDLSQTEKIRQKLPKIIKTYQIKTMLDIPCGDFSWMKDVNLSGVHYTGADIVDELIIHNNRNYSDASRTFKKLDVLKDLLPPVDLIFCRDCFVHFSNEDIFIALDNIIKSNARYLMTTTFTECENNVDIVTGDWRIINLQVSPFSLPEPVLILNEGCTEGEGTYADKSLGLWKISDLR